MYPNLKLQIWKSGMRQNRLAQLVGIHETLLSKILNGFREADAETRARIAAVLQSDAVWLFTQEAPVIKSIPLSDSLEMTGKAQGRNEL
jgi:transcriptional regulator with XRE-family HTH domain